MINTQIQPGTTSFTISAFLPEGVSLVELAVTIGGLTIGITSTAVYGLATLIIKPPNLRPGEAQIMIETASPDVNVTLTVTNIMSEKTNTLLEVPWEDKTYHVNFFSNCTVFDIEFNDTRKTISFNVATQPETIGFCNVTIPKELLRSNVTHPWKVKLNGTDTDFTHAENTTHSFIYFNIFDTGMYTIEIIGAEVIPEFPTPILVLLMILMLLVVVLRKRYTKNYS